MGDRQTKPGRNIIRVDITLDVSRRGLHERAIKFQALGVRTNPSGESHR